MIAARCEGPHGEAGEQWEQQVDWDMTHKWAGLLHKPAGTAAAALTLPISMMARNTLPPLFSTSLSP